ncbi:MAG: hypothetical protein K8W52_32880, partial [Deltaproteobacteria bacterium]|nr:hypothetical protein [Deltaproteobacteria bacterium]
MDRRPGTVTEVSPADATGWIELDDGERVLFGASGCRLDDFRVGARVAVCGTKPSFRGVIKAVKVEPLAVTAAPAPPTPRPARAALLALCELGLELDDALQAIVARADADDQFHADLGALGFDLAPMRAEAIACAASGLHVVAMDRDGRAIGRYVATDAPPGAWVAWDPATDALGFLAPDTAALFAGLCARGEAAIDE